MAKRFLVAMCTAFMVTALCAAFAIPTAAQSVTPAQAAARLLGAYPDYLERIDGNEIVWRDGTRMTLDDGRGSKTFEALLETPDLDDIFAIPYVPGDPATPPAVNEDPGRARPAAFYNKMYGDCRTGGVKANLVDVVWLPRKSGQTLQVTKVNGVAAKLAAVSAELDALPASFDSHLRPAAGSYVCRAIAGTNRTSTHGHGIAIDISTKHAHYWRWDKPAANGNYPHKNEIPMEIVRAFEKHGFIWGGKWYHYDTMHFEYRPELLEK
jgi:D-alanyl-D-alanine carboxypeptidase